MPNPFGMAEFSIPQMIGLDRQLKSDRLEQMYKQRQIEREDVQWDRQQKDWERQDKRDAALAKVYGSASPPAPSNSILPEDNQVPAAGPPPGSAAGTPAPAAASGRPQINQAALNELRSTGMDGVKLANDIEKLNADQVKSAQEALKSSMEIKGRVISGVRALPPEQREAAYQTERANLINSGIPAEQLPPKWDENAADQLVQESLTVAEALGMGNEAKRLAETVRHNRAAEGTAAGNLALSRQREGRITKWGPQPLFGTAGINPNAPADNSDLEY